MLCMVAVGGLGLAIYAALLFRGLPDAAELAEYRPPTSTRVYAWDGTLIAQLGQERRIFTPYDQIPPLVIRAFLAAEDHKFFEHGGIDVEGLGRAMSRDVFRAANKQRLQGGSTITQQVAKNILLTNEQDLRAKGEGGHLSPAHRADPAQVAYPGNLSQPDRPWEPRLRRGRSRLQLLRQDPGRARPSTDRLPRRLAQGPRQLQPHHPQGRRHRATELDPEPDGPARLGREARRFRRRCRRT